MASTEEVCVEEYGYEPPRLEDIGSLRQLTRQSKNFGGSDGFDIGGVPIGNASLS